MTDLLETAVSEIRVTDLCKVYGSGKNTVEALSHVDLVIPEGRFVSLFGPSGCGKTTLLRILAGLDDFTSGQVTLFGQSPHAATREKNIAWIPQSSALLPWTSVADNVLLSSRVNKRADKRANSTRVPQDAATVLAQMGLGKFGRARPAQLSGGMRQRASIARGFVQGAPLMLMDEPFSALDEFTRDALREQLLDMWDVHRKTIVFVTHSVAEAVLLSDTVVVMTARPGKIEAIVDIDLPRPRGVEVQNSAEFHDKIVEVRTALQNGWARS